MAINKQKILKNAYKYTKKNQYDRAIEEYRKLTQDDYGESSLNNTIGDLLVRAKNLQEAVIEYEKAGRYYEEKGFIPKALAIYKKVVRCDPSRSQVYAKLAQLYSDQGLIQDAIEQFQFLADHHREQGNLDLALDAYRQVSELDPTNLEVRDKLASLYSQKGYNDKAYSERISIGERYIQRHDLDEALRNFEIALDELPDHEEALRGIVKIYMLQENAPKAKEVLRQILDRDPDHIEALVMMGRICLDNEDLDGAVKFLKRVTHLDPSREHVYEMLGQAYIQMGNFQDAFYHWKEIIHVAIERNDFAKALSYLDQLQDVEPKNIKVREKKIEIFQKLNRQDEIKRTLKELAEIYYEKGKLEESYNIYERLFTMDPHDQEIQLRFNQISIELRGRPIEIKQLLERPTFDSFGEDDSLLFTAPSESDNRSLDEIFDTSEIEKISIPIFEEADGPPLESDDELLENLFTEDNEMAPSSRTRKKKQIDLSQIREYRIESGVFMKYGLLEKATDRLLSILDLAPEDEESMEKLTDVYEKLGQIDKAVQMIIRRTDLLVRNDSSQLAIQLLEYGQRIAPSNQELKNRLRQLKNIAVGFSSDPGSFHDADDLPGGSDWEPLVPLPDTDQTSYVFSDAQELIGDIHMLDKSTSSDGSGAELTDGLSDVVREYREGIIEKKDADTHYNLGMAYREMGLLDEAIAEFKIAYTFPNHRVSSGSLLAQCYMERNEPEEAFEILSNIIGTQNLEESEILSIKYDSAMALKSADDYQQALNLLEEIQQIKANYRDVPSQIKALKSQMK